MNKVVFEKEKIVIVTSATHLQLELAGTSSQNSDISLVFPLKSTPNGLIDSSGKIRDAESNYTESVEYMSLITGPSLQK